jgi:hypothetical protein
MTEYNLTWLLLILMKPKPILQDIKTEEVEAYMVQYNGVYVRNKELIN